MSERKKPGWAFWTTVAIALPMLYVASFGPACWITAQPYLGGTNKASGVMLVYVPLGYAGFHAPLGVRRLIHGYAWLGVGKEKYTLLMRDIHGSQYLPPRK